MNNQNNQKESGLAVSDQTANIARLICDLEKTWSAFIDAASEIYETDEVPKRFHESFTKIRQESGAMVYDSILDMMEASGGKMI